MSPLGEEAGIVVPASCPSDTHDQGTWGPYGQACQSAANICGQRNNGTYGCGSVCNATTPSNYISTNNTASCAAYAGSFGIPANATTGTAHYDVRCDSAIIYTGGCSCTANNSCAATTCVGQSCTNNCGGSVAGTFSGTNTAGSASCAVYAGSFGIPATHTVGTASYTQNSCTGAITYLGGCSAPPVVNGVCAATHNNCTAGTSGGASSDASNWYWNCNGSGGGSNASCSEAKPPLINGVCDATHYNCTTGTASGGSQDASSWYWNCLGSGGGSSMACSEAKAAVINGVCGGTHNNCTVGTSASPSSDASYWYWLCNGSGGGSNAICSETKPAPVNGVCAATHNNCTAGTSGGASSDASNWYWNCNGSGGGSNASCSQAKAALINGVCGGTHNNCSAGTSANPTSDASYWYWNCLGSSGGSNTSCSEAKPLPTYSITASAGTGCSIAPSGIQSGIAQGSNRSFTISPLAGYTISNVTVDGSGIGAAGSYTFNNITANHTISAACVSVVGPSVSISATPSSIYAGDSTLINWNTSNVTSCWASGGAGGWGGNWKSHLGGSESISPAITATYSIECWDGGGTSTGIQSITVNVSASVNGVCAATHYNCSAGTSASNVFTGAAWNWTCQGLGAGTNAACTESVGSPTATLTATPNPVVSGNPITIAWTTGGGVTSCWASNTLNIAPWTSWKSHLGGSESDTPLADNTYFLECWDGSGTSTGMKSVSVTILPAGAPTVTLSAAPATIPTGNSSTLTWTTSGAATCNSWTSVGNASDFTGTQNATGGNQSVSPLLNSTYNIECFSGTGVSSGVSTATVTVTGVLAAVHICPTVATVSVASTQNLTAWYTPAGTSFAGCAAPNGSNVTATATWSSSNPGAVSVNTTGVITGVAPGSANIGASYSGVNDSIVATVACVPTNSCGSASSTTTANTLCTGSTFNISDGCGNTLVCNGTRACDYNWKEVAPF